MHVGGPLGGKLWVEAPRALDIISGEIEVWHDHNFPGTSIEIATLGVGEEAGELQRAVLKRVQAIRGTHEEWTAELRKECGDVLIKVIEVCGREGWDAMEVLIDRWSEVRWRDFQVDQVGHGIDKA